MHRPFTMFALATGSGLLGNLVCLVRGTTHTVMPGYEDDNV